MVFALCVPLIPVAAASPANTAVDGAVHAWDTTPGAIPRFEPARCPFPLGTGQTEGTNVTCGFVVVPEDHANPSGPTIRLATAQFKAVRKNPPPEPIVYLEGGPGEAAIGASTASFAARFTASRDFVIFDQRGTGRSEPSLGCSELQSQPSQNISLADSEQQRIDQLFRCRDRLVGAGIDLSAYTTDQNAADVNDLRAALGYDKLDLLGVSYGTRLGLTVMRDFPQAVNSVVLDSVSALQVDSYAQYPVSFDRALNVLFSSCAADSACSTAFPNLPADFSQTVAQLDTDPVTVTVTNPRTKGADTFVTNGWRFTESLQGWLYSSYRLRYLPMLIEQVKAGDTTLLTYFDTLALTGGGSTSSGMVYSVRCSDYAPFGSAETMTMAAQGLLPEIRDDYVPGERDIFTICAQWPTKPANPIDHQPVTSDIPTLVLASGNDPVTPPAFSQMTAQTLSHGFYVEVPGIGHSVLSNGGTCALNVIERFFTAPTRRPNTDCTSALGVTYVTTGKIYPNPPPMTIDPTKQYTATIVTNKGTMSIQLYADVAPLAVNNFVFLASDHFYDGVPFHRVLTGLLAQTGDPTGSGVGGPGYTFTDDPVPDNLDYVRGTVAMANRDPAASGSQFVLCADALHEPSKTFTIFGKVTDGLDVLDTIVAVPRAFGCDGAQSKPTEPVFIISVTVQAQG
jgi:cyclophilin family peptidyl-prolyl cis-trans isomerase/pimeloyl-ACP methyl ester carboxylesterase